MRNSAILLSICTLILLPLAALQGWALQMPFDILNVTSWTDDLPANHLSASFDLEGFRSKLEAAKVAIKQSHAYSMVLEEATKPIEDLDAASFMEDPESFKGYMLGVSDFGEVVADSFIGVAIAVFDTYKVAHCALDERKCFEHGRPKSDLRLFAELMDESGQSALKGLLHDGDTTREIAKAMARAVYKVNDSRSPSAKAQTIRKVTKEHFIKAAGYEDTILDKIKEENRLPLYTAMLDVKGKETLRKQAFI
ncbi:hypothetical protein JAAARDRAFT_38978 [Jaapia argillacea MUCL 33604]|uniref:Uncharacterized protein n=1 Tax=Jaapia argillacea MUCL 33604 TaxID=933084 RepID=A0A067PFH3_9AGAM|nr:hypothetical protein JAAARDRAFT_38978 [Jaapia argillacea MUCL 33604]